MNKRMDAIRSFLATTQDVPGKLSADNQALELSADNSTPSMPRVSPRVSSGSVRAMKESFSQAERENEELRAKLATGAAIQDIDPSLIDPSPVSDRFQDDDGSFEALKFSINQRGQEVPVLLRPHPSVPGRYQSAYGHRRVRAAKELGIQVRAVIKPLTDEDLVIAQGVENSAREDLTFIERAFFALRLEDAGYARNVVQDALSVDKAEASKLVTVAKALPVDIVEAIGRAPKVGRPRWLALVEALRISSSAIKAARAVIKAPKFSEQDTDTRFITVLTAATDSPKKASKAEPQHVITVSGRRVAQVVKSGRDLKVAIDRKFDAAFVDFLIDKFSEQLPALAEQFIAGEEGEK
ncbi:plasmid partitioning protein RepB [Microvirga puerhi]|uniref:Plasmid partitioning protein RepB n=1 Tax=Microvirga puerhi TaxID=2876078 RepID=A0ABS7VUN2_9HYPH|nr:plasmid partitioning protein RepB [Microvirga puerhi]MBZ6078856.1 plasmid partitioning protein RepB [Microvirga puerhi]